MAVLSKVVGGFASAVAPEFTAGLGTSSTALGGPIGTYEHVAGSKSKPGQGRPYVGSLGSWGEDAEGGGASVAWTMSGIVLPAPPFIAM